MEPPSAPRPTLLRNLGFWLLAMGLGSGLLLFVVAFWAFGLVPPSRDSTGALGFALWVVGVSGVLSLAALPLLLPLLPWALGAGPVALRWLRVFTLQSLSLGLLTCLAYCLDGLEPMIPLAATAYFVAGLLAAPLTYAPWLLATTFPSA